VVSITANSPAAARSPHVRDRRRPQQPAPAAARSRSLTRYSVFRVGSRLLELGLEGNYLETAVHPRRRSPPFDQDGPHEGPAPRPGHVPSARRGRSQLCRRGNPRAPDDRWLADRARARNRWSQPVIGGRPSAIVSEQRPPMRRRAPTFISISFRIGQDANSVARQLM